MLPATPADLASLIDHTLLKADATEEQIRTLCREAVDHGFFGVCVNPRWIPLVTKELGKRGPLAVAVVGFPLGASFTDSKAQEASKCLSEGAREIDMVVDLGALKSGDWKSVADDIRAVKLACGAAPLKVILETCYLTQDEIRQTTLAALGEGVAFVKTSTGFGSSGANVLDVRLMKTLAGQKMNVKASGGIRTFKFARELLLAGADRLGCSNSVAILDEARRESLV
jgi:deoxyribose-phosphate aldolase